MTLGRRGGSDVATTFDEWLNGRRAAVAGAGPGRWLSTEQLLADDAAALRRLFDVTVVNDRVPVEVAAVALSGWHGGGLATVVGLGLAVGVGVAVTIDGVRFHHHADGGVDAVDPGPATLLVAAAHPWSGAGGVTVLDDVDDVIDAAVASLVAAVEPLVSAIPSIHRVGRSGLWNEVGDALGMALCEQDAVLPTAGRQALLDRAVRSRHRRWKAAPDVRVIARPAAPVVVGRKGGCCLLHRRSAEPLEVAALTESERRYLERFPVQQPDYCSTCSLRSVADCEARQLFWLDLVEEAGSAR
ncbi:MAG: hypothetical protein QM733_08960 [Ilumatobacteraceae bacterium]